MAITPQIRRAIHADWERVLPLLRQMGSINTEQIIRGRFDRLIQHSDHYFQIALSVHKIAGYGWAQDYGPHLRSGDRTTPRLHDLYTSTAYWGQGIGTALLYAIKAWAEQRGIRYLEWQASTSAVGFYHRLGYIGNSCPRLEYPFFEIELV